MPIGKADLAPAQVDVSDGDAPLNGYRVVRHGAEKQVVGFRHRAADVVPEGLSGFKLFKIKSGYCVASQFDMIAYCIAYYLIEHRCRTAREPTRRQRNFKKSVEFSEKRIDAYYIEPCLSG